MEWEEGVGTLGYIYRKTGFSLKQSYYEIWAHHATAALLKLQGQVVDLFHTF